MILDIPVSLVNFCSQFLPTLGQFAPAHVAEMLPAILAAIASSSGPRNSLSSIGKQVYGHVRHKSTISRMLRCKSFRSRDLHWELIRLLLLVLAPLAGSQEWLLAIDATSLQRGADTRIRGGIHPDRRQANKLKRKVRKCRANGKRITTAREAKKGRKTKYFTVLLGALITHQGVRLALPRYTCDPKDFNRGPGRPKSKRETQLDLAKVMILKLLRMLSKSVKLVVVADSYYESQKLVRCARARGFTFISPLDTNRCFARKDDPNKSNGSRIWNHGLKLPKETSSRLDLVRGSEETASYRRYSQRTPGPRDRRTYWLHHERRTVAKLGEVGIVYSWKTPVYEPRKSFGRKSFKILMCSNPTWSAQKVAEWYEMRWTAIEILIRELKQELGFEDYSGLSLQAMERYLDLVLISFLYLEMRRVGVLDDADASPTERHVAATARTSGMKGLVRAEADRQLLSAIHQALYFPRQRRLVMDFLSADTQMHRFTNP